MSAFARVWDAWICVLVILLSIQANCRRGTAIVYNNTEIDKCRYLTYLHRMALTGGNSEKGHAKDRHKGSNYEF
jgi:hypothetical protein